MKKIIIVLAVLSLVGLVGCIPKDPYPEITAGVKSCISQNKNAIVVALSYKPVGVVCEIEEIEVTPTR